MNDLLTDPDHIREYRAILAAHISVLLERQNAVATIDDVKAVIFNDDERKHPSEYFADLLALFSAPVADLDVALAIIQDAWNYFPHNSLNGRCPAEVMVDNLRLSKARRSGKRRLRRSAT